MARTAHAACLRAVVQHSSTPAASCPRFGVCFSCHWPRFPPLFPLIHDELQVPKLPWLVQHLIPSELGSEAAVDHQDLAGDVGRLG